MEIRASLWSPVFFDTCRERTPLRSLPNQHFLGNFRLCQVLTKPAISLHYPSVVLDGELAAPRTRKRDPKSAIAGYNSLQSNGRIARRGSAALKAGSGAARTCEPRQDRKVATVSGNPWVPSGHLAGASDPRTAGCPPRRKVHDFFLSVVVRSGITLSYRIRVPRSRTRPAASCTFHSLPNGARILYHP